MPDGIGAVGLARQCVAALEALAECRDAGEIPTAAHRGALAGWAGWGPLAPAMEWTPKKDTWREIRGQLLKLVSHADLETAGKTLDTAFYTPPAVTAAIWQLVTGLGFTGGAVLEPGCGTGRFMAAAPAGLDIAWTGVEADKASAEIAALLNPGARIIGARLEKTPLRLGSFDLAVGNVPFSKTEPYDPTCPKLNLHNYFLYRALQAVRPGGLVACVTSRYTLDSADNDQRHYLRKLGTLAGAIRLPGSALAAGGTDVTTDIVVFRRHDSNDLDKTWAGVWHGVAPHDDTLMTTVNPYFRANPSLVPGSSPRGAAPNSG